MNLNDETRTRILIDVTDITATPVGSTVSLKIGDTYYAATWQGSPVLDASTGTYSQTARTTPYFAGPAVPTGDVAGAEVLQLGRYDVEAKVTFAGGDIIAVGVPALHVVTA